MDEIVEQALINMTSVLQSFLPAVEPSVDQSLIIIPQNIKPTGLSGYVGTHQEPDASLLGRHIQAISEVSLISDNGIADLQIAVSNVTQALLSQDRLTLRNNGIFKLQFDQVSEISHAGSGNNATDTRLVRFNLDFETIPVPVEEEGTIDFFIHHFDLALAQGKARFYQLNFVTLSNAGDNPLAYFNLEDDPGIAGASPAGSWAFDAGQGYIEQTNNVRGGPVTAGGRKAGAHALVRISNAPYLVNNFIAKTTINTSGQDGIGFVFRKQDDNNFYYLLLSARHNYTLLGKKVAGVYGALDEGGLNDTQGHTGSTNMEIKLIVDGNRFMVYLNNQFVVAGNDSAIAESGRLGFFTHRNAGAHFFDLTLVEFGSA